MSISQLIEVDQRGRASLGKNLVAPGHYLLEIDNEGVITLHPAQVVKNSQLKLSKRTDLMKNIDTLSAKSDLAPSKRGRPKRAPKN